MTVSTEAVHRAFLGALGNAVQWCSAIRDKPLCVNLALPCPPRLRAYIYTLVGGVGTVRPKEYKAVLRLRGQAVGAYRSFDHSEGRFALVVGYRADLDVFVLWDASLHSRFTNGGNIQVHADTVHEAAVVGRANQKRTLSSNVTEVVIACQSWSLKQALDDRVGWTGGGEEGLRGHAL